MPSWAASSGGACSAPRSGERGAGRLLSRSGAGRAGRLVHGHALAGLQRGHRGLRDLCRAGRRQAGAHARLLDRASVGPGVCSPDRALGGRGGWFMGMRSLVSNVVPEDYVTYAELGGVKRGRILGSYVMRNALVPQVTGLAMSLGAIFNGAIITEQVFGYPGVGTLLVSAVHAGDYSLVLGITTVSILAVSIAVLLIDLAYPLLDPRVRAR